MTPVPVPAEILERIILDVLSTIQSGIFISNPNPSGDWPQFSRYGPEVRMSLKMKVLLDLIHVCKTWRLVIFGSEKIRAEPDFRAIEPVPNDKFLLEALALQSLAFDQVNNLFLPPTGTHILRQVSIYARQLPSRSWDSWMTEVGPVMARAESLEIVLSGREAKSYGTFDLEVNLHTFLNAMGGSNVLKHLVFDRLISVVDTPPNSSQLLHLGISLPNLRTADISCLLDMPSLPAPFLVELTLENCGLTFNGLKDLAGGSPLLRTLVLNQVRRGTKFRIPVNEVRQVHFPSLRKLNVRPHFRNHISIEEEAEDIIYEVSTPQLTQFSLWMEVHDVMSFPVRPLGLALHSLTTFELMIGSISAWHSLGSVVVWLGQASTLEVLRIVSEDSNPFMWKNGYGRDIYIDITPIIESLLDTSMAIRCPNLKNITCKGDHLRSSGLLRRLIQRRSESPHREGGFPPCTLTVIGSKSVQDLIDATWEDLREYGLDAEADDTGPL